MTTTDYLVLGGILLVLFWAIRVRIRRRAQGKCCSGDCAHCSHSCGK